MSFSDGRIVELDNSGAWFWFMGERVVGHDDMLLVGPKRCMDKS